MIRGKKTSLVAFEPSYGSVIQRWMSDRDYRFYFRNMPEVLSCDQYAMFPRIMNMNILMIIDPEGSIIGMASWDNIRFLARTCEVGFLIDKQAQAVGFTKDAWMAFADYLFNRLGFYKVSTKVALNQKRTWEICKWGGFRNEGILEREFYMDGQHHDEIRLILFQDEFNKRLEKYKKGEESWEKVENRAEDSQEVMN